MTDLSSKAVFKRLSEIFITNHVSEDPLAHTNMRLDVRELDRKSVV